MPVKRPTQTDPAREADGIEFELIDIKDAKHVLDVESLAQFEVAAVVRPGQWKRLRRASLPTDRALSGKAIDWLIALPTNLRPEKLALQFPRLVNALAEVWDEPEQCQLVLDGLLTDTRKGRQGFPPAVHDELVALRDWTQVF